MASNTTNITTKFRADITDFKAAMQEVKNKISLANSEFKKMASTCDDWEKDVNGLSAKLKQLDTVLSAQERGLEALETDYRKVSNEQGENSIAAMKLATQINNQKAAINDTKKAIDTYGSKLKEAERDTGNLTTKISKQEAELKSLKTQYTQVAAAKGKDSTEAKELKTQIDKLNTELKENYTNLRNVGTQSTEVDKKMDTLGKSAVDAGEKAVKGSGGFSTFKQVLGNLITEGINKAIDGMKQLAVSSLEVGSAFDSSMSNVQALISGRSENIVADMAQIEEEAKRLGATTEYTAAEAADGFGKMALAGWGTEDMIKNMGYVLNLATASGMDLASTSDLITDYLTAFGLSADDTGRFCDSLAEVMRSTNTDLVDLEEAFKMSAGTAGAMGYSIEDVSVALGLMANAGIKSSIAGTSLRKLLTNMANPTDAVGNAMKDLNLSLIDGAGNSKSFVDVMKNLREGFSVSGVGSDELKKKLNSLTSAYESGAMSEEEYNDQLETLMKSSAGAKGILNASNASIIAGKTGMAGLLSIISASDEEFNSLVNTMGSADGTTEDMANIMRDNFAGDVKIMNSAIDAFKQNIYNELEPSLRKLMKYITDTVVPALNKNVIPAIKNIVEYVSSKVIPFIMNTLLPTLKDIFFPILESMVDIFKNIIYPLLANFVIPIFKVLVDFIKDVLVPQFQNLVDFIIAYVVPQFEILTDILNAFVIPGFSGLVEFLKNTVIPEFGNLVDYIEQNVNPKLSSFGQSIKDGFKDALNNAKGLDDNSQKEYTIKTTTKNELFTDTSNSETGDRFADYRDRIPDYDPTQTAYNLGIVGQEIIKLGEIFGTYLKPMLDTLSEGLEQAIVLLQPVLQIVSDLFSEQLVNIVNQISEAIQIFMLPFTSDHFQLILQSLSESFTTFMYGITTLFEGIGELGINGQFMFDILKASMLIFNGIIQGTLTLLSFLMGLFGLIFTLIGEFFKKIRELKDKIVVFINDIPKKIEAFVDKVSRFKDRFEIFFKMLPVILKRYINDFFNKTKQDISDKMSSIYKTIADWINNIVVWFENKINVFSQFGTNIKNSIINGFNGIVNDMKTIGKNIITGLWNGITSNIKSFGSGIVNVGSGIVDGFKDFFGIHSPSRLMSEEIGKYIPLGISEGINKYKNNVSQTIDGITSNLKDVNMNISGKTTGETSSSSYTFNQTINSPKSLSRLDIYRQTKNQLSFAL